MCEDSFAFLSTHYSILCNTRRVAMEIECEVERLSMVVSVKVNEYRYVEMKLTHLRAGCI